MIKKYIRRIIPWIDMDKKIEKWYIKSHKLYLKGNKFLANYYSYKISKRYNCYISPKAEIGNNICFPHPTGIVIGEGVKIGDNCIIYQNVTLGRKDRNIPEYPQIKDNVIIYCNSTVIGNVTIGNNAIIGCNSVILRSVEDNSKCRGVVK